MILREKGFEKLERLVLDENKIVTTKMLSHELKIHVQEAKQYLNDFYKAQKLKLSSSLHANFFIMGTIENNGEKRIKILVAHEESLEEVKKSFVEVSSCHIHSISKVKQMDNCSLYNAERDYFKTVEYHGRYAAIKCSKVEMHSPKLKIISTNGSSTVIFKKQENSTGMTNGISPHSNKQSVENVPKEKYILENNASKGIEPDKNNTENIQKQNTLASLWQKNEAKSKVDKKEESKSAETKKKSPQGSEKNAPKQNIKSMFFKQAEKNATNTKNTTANPPAKKVEEKFATVENSTKPSSISVKEIHKTGSKSVSKKRKSFDKPKEQSSKNEEDFKSDEHFRGQKKKHRRIMVLDDSDSESDSEEAQDRLQRTTWSSKEDTNEENPLPHDVPMEDDEEPIPPTPPVNLHKNKKRVLKTVSKTYQDEEGYFVTKQEKELISASDDEDPLPPKKASPTKQKQASNKKQSSLTSFFTRK